MILHTHNFTHQTITDLNIQIVSEVATLPYKLFRVHLTNYLNPFL